MSYTTLALPGLMVTQLLLDLFAVFPNDEGLLATSAVLLSLSFAVLFGAVPFHSWLSTVATDGSPPVVTYIFTVQLGTVWFMLLDYLQTYLWLERQAALGTILTDLGVVMLVLGGLLAASQRRLGKLAGYAMLADNGAMLLALGSERQEGMALAMLILLARPLALGLMTLGLQGCVTSGVAAMPVRRCSARPGMSPWRTAAFLLGGVAMAGFPVSLGFAARWSLYDLLADQSLFLATLGLLGGAGGDARRRRRDPRPAHAACPDARTPDHRGRGSHRRRAHHRADADDVSAGFFPPDIGQDRAAHGGKLYFLPLRYGAPAFQAGAWDVPPAPPSIDGASEV